MRIVHRDLKPENILLVEPPNKKKLDLKLADFGFAKKIPEGKKEELSCGTPFYTAPEMIKGRPYDFKVDIWSLGVIAFFLLTGQYPF
jgi:serine/threonine-protein kinase ULK2